MSMTILATKLYIPPPRPNVVRRPRLLERLNEGLQRQLTLISAPTGFGKTTLIGEWVKGIERPTAWLSLDDGDHDPTRFLTYLVASLQAIDPSVGEEVLRALQSSRPLPPEAILTILLNDLAIRRDPLVLVLDDYHVIDTQPGDRVLTYLVEHLPPQMHLVIATREDPHLPLARMRAAGQLTELRTSDLRFTPSEAVAFLSEVSALTLTAEDVARLLERTEGWIAGLQLAALSLRDRQDASGFIQAFAGDHRYIMDYLVEEVLARQPVAVRNFLLQTAILDRLHGPLCDAITDQEDSIARLEALERGNFFVVSLDDKRQWYRYHHLFAEMLSAHLQAELPEQVAPLHRRASAWFEQQGLTADAIRHALAAEDFARAADLIELAVPSMHRGKQETTLLGWMQVLPDELVRCRPVLSVGYAWAFLARGELDAADARLRDAERWLGATADVAPGGTPQETPSTEMVIADEAEFRRLPATIAVYRAAHAQALGKVAETVHHARRALDLTPETDQLGRGAATALLGLASWSSGDLETAYQMFADGMAYVLKAGNIADVISGATALADIRIAQGRLHEAMRTYERALQLATERGNPIPRGTADLYVGMSALLCEHDDLPAARQHLLNSQELGEHNGVQQSRYRWYVAKARIRKAEGDLDGALDLLHEAERVYVGDFFPTVRPIAALVAGVWVAQGRIGEALSWAREQGLSRDDNLSFLREFEHITLSRVLLAQYEQDHAVSPLREAIGLLERLLQAAQAGGRTGSVIEIQLLLALANQALGDLRAALMPLGRALTLAEPEGYVRLLADEGPAMARLLRTAVAHRIAPNYAGRLLTAVSVVHDEDHQHRRSASAAPLPASSSAQPLIEPLTQREVDVLRLLTTELSGPEIADQLVVALSTVHTHTKSIYSKLNVTNRRAAVKRATELHLL
jgi:LuxR family maltose regulon positive regulatory protein